jgi:two-component system, OmpR family, response regulator protein BraR/BceR
MKMAVILIIEDNLNICKEVSTYFRGNGFDTICGDALPDGNLPETVDAVLLDINLKNTDGFDICKRIRRVSDVPILFVTGRDSEEDELKAMALGGDDYIRKPYSLPVLLAKVRRMLERVSVQDPVAFQSGDVCFNAVTGQLMAGSQVMELSKNEIKVLYCLFIHKNCVVSKDELIEYLWDNKLYVDENILNVNLSRLRKRLTEFGYPDLIETVYKKGYRIKE